MNRVVVLSMVLAVGAMSDAHAYCSEPYLSVTIPDPPGSYDRPDVPFCLSSYKWSGEHDCDSWDLDRYKDEVEEYIEELNDFVEEVDQLAREISLFADEALTYAKCEAEEVATQHK